MATNFKSLFTRTVDSKQVLKLEQTSINPESLAEKQVLVRVEAVAQNPTDVHALDRKAFPDGSVLGCDFAGEVVAVGKSVTRVKKGDKIGAFIWGGETKGIGGYAEYSIADDDMYFPIPPSVDVNAAATIPLALATAWLALFSSGYLGIERGGKGEGSGNEGVLIWGGSSSVGSYAIQLCAHYHIPVTTTCSPKSFAHCKSLGATHVFDYKDADVATKIREQVPGIRFTFDCIGRKDSSALASESLSPVEGKEGFLCTVRPGKEDTEGVKKRVRITGVLVFTVFYKKHRYGKLEWEPLEEDHALGVELFTKLPEWLEKGIIQPNKVKIVEGDLETGVEKGFQMHRDGEVSGFKIVYNP